MKKKRIIIEVSISGEVEATVLGFIKMKKPFKHTAAKDITPLIEKEVDIERKRLFRATKKNCLFIIDEIKREEALKKIFKK